MFLERLDELIEEKGISRNEVAKALGLSSGLFTSWQQRKNVPSGDVISKIADYFEVSTDYILERTNIKDPYLTPKNEKEIVKNYFFNNPENITDEKFEELEKYAKFIESQI